MKDKARFSKRIADQTGEARHFFFSGYINKPQLQIQPVFGWLLACIH
jgi:hypothetical protein